MIRKHTFTIVFSMILLMGVSLSALFSQQPPKDMIKGKETNLGKYILAGDAYRRWQANPEGIKMLDVRTPAEYVYVGHAPMARNIPLIFMSPEWDITRVRYKSRRNPELVERVKALWELEDTILVMCRSGGRSGSTCNILAEAGFKNVFNIVDGFEGDFVHDPGSYFDGKRVKNGWKNSGAPWTYKLDSKLVYKPEAQQ